MNSITFGYGYFLAILVVNVFSSEYHFLSESPNFVQLPFEFIYNKYRNNFLLMEITFKNIPSTVTTIYLLHNNYVQENTQPKVKVNTENQTGQLMILGNLIYNTIYVGVEVRTKMGVCTTIGIANGRATDDPNYLSGLCLAPHPCKMLVDLENKCTEDNLICNSNASTYNCTLNIGRKTDNWYILYQNYDNIDSFIGGELPTKAKNIHFFMKLELFDNNTSVNVALLEDRTNILLSDKIIIKAKDFGDYNAATLRYNETRDVQFICEKYYKHGSKLVMHIGIINTTNNKITTHYNTSSIERKFKMADNGTILCCIYYTSKWGDEGITMNIRRIIENKTLLIYQSQGSTSLNLTENEEQTTTSLTDWIIYLVPAFLAICVLMLALYIVKQNRCCTEPHPVEETVELKDCANQNQVLYANLDLVRDEMRPPGLNEEPHYANIIGVLHPL